MNDPVADSSDIAIDASAYDGTGNLDSSVVNVQELADVVNSLQVMPPASTTPRITSFSLTGWNSTVSQGTQLGGSKSLAFTVENGSNVQGQLELDIDGRRVALISVNAPIPVSVNVPSITAEFNITHTATLKGIATDGTHFQRQITTHTAPATHEFYFGTQASNQRFTSASILSNYQHATYTRDQTVTINAWTGDQYAVIADREDDPDLTSIRYGGFDALGDFTKITTTVDINGVTYELWVSNQVLPGANFPNGLRMELVR